VFWKDASVKRKPSSGSSLGAHRTLKQRTFSVYTVTWNVGDGAPPYDRLDALFDKKCAGDISYDIIAVGAQEAAYKPRIGQPSVEQDWIDALNHTLHEGGNYVLLSYQSVRNSIRLAVWIKAEFKPLVTEIKGSTHSTSIPVLIRKGGVGISFSIAGTSLCFMTAHLAAHQEYTKSRNAETFQIFTNLRLGNPNYDVANQFHHSFLLGDLNYRCDTTWHDAVTAIETHDLTFLSKFDQLLLEMSKGLSLANFQEAPLTFAPTFKLARGTRSSYDGKRVPSWCDRILYNSLPEYDKYLQILKYASIDDVLSSDHVPVCATFQLKVPEINEIPMFPLVTFTLRLTNVEAELTLSPEDIAAFGDFGVNPRLICSGGVVDLFKSSVQQNSPKGAVWLELPSVKTKTVPQGVLPYQHMFLAVYNYKSDQYEELIGQGVISLKPYSTPTNPPAPITFKTTLYLGGVKRGSVRGNLMLAPL
jgi:hypothetical protein